MVGAELPTDDGHLLALDVPEVVPALARPARAVIADIHAAGGFAVVPHPFTHGGWRDWDADFDGLEIQNSASDFRRLLGPLLPFRIARLAWDRPGSMARLWLRPARELAKFEELLLAGRRLVPFAGADAHQNVSLLGWQLDPYREMFRGARMVCPDAPLEAKAIWRLLRGGSCVARWEIYEPRASEALWVEYRSGRSELQLDDGARVLEVAGPPHVSPVYSGR